MKALERELKRQLRAEAWRAAKRESRAAALLARPDAPCKARRPPVPQVPGIAIENGVERRFNTLVGEWIPFIPAEWILSSTFQEEEAEKVFGFRIIR